MTPAVVVGMMLVAGACHAGWNLVAKRVDGDRTMLLVAASALIVVGLLPWGITHLPGTGSLAVGLGCVVLRGTLNVAYLVGLSRSYHHFDLSVGYPLVRGTGPVVATIGAVLLLDERPAVTGVIGVAVTSVAILALAATARTVRGTTHLAGRAGAWVVFTGVTIGAYTVVDKIGLNYWDPVAYLWAVEVTGASLASLYLVRQRRASALVDILRRQPGDTVTCACLIAASYLLALFALEHTLASYIAPMRETSVLFGALLGMLVLKEERSPQRFLAALGIVAGLCLVGLAV